MTREQWLTQLDQAQIDLRQCRLAVLDAQNPSDIEFAASTVRRLEETVSSLRAIKDRYDD